MSALVRDLRIAARALRRSPGFTLAAVLTLAIGIGSNTALFSIVDSILWKPYPYPQAERLVVVRSAVERRGVRRSNISLPNFSDIRTQSNLLEDLAVWDWEPYGLATRGDPVRVGGARVSASFFDVMGMPPLLGTTFRPEHDHPSAERVVILGEGLWKERFGGDREIVGTSVLINGRSHTVLGVMPAAAEFPDNTRLWVPLRFAVDDLPRYANWLGSLGRLKEGADLASLNAEIGGIGDRLQQEFPEANEGRIHYATLLRSDLTGDMRQMSLLVLGVVAFVLLIVCANIANLLLSRGVGREREVAIRRALGAAGGRLLQTLVCESLLLAAAGGLLGFGLGWLLVRRIARSVAERIPPWVSTTMDLRVVGYTLGASVFAAVLFSLFPLWQLLRQDVGRALHRGGHQQLGSRKGRRLRGALVVSEVALCLTLLVGAGLLLKSLVGLSTVNPGFEPRGVVRVGLDLLGQTAEQRTRRAIQFQQHIDRLEAVPGAQAVGAIDLFPLQGRSNSIPVATFGQSVEEARDNPNAQYSNVTPGYFEAMGIPILRGATFGPGEESNSEVIVSQHLARLLWGGEEPIGRRLTLGRPDEEAEWMTVRGVVGDITHHGLDRAAPPHLYVPYAVSTPGRMTIVVRGSGDAEALIGSIRAAVHEVDPHQPLHEVMPVEAAVDASMWQWRFFGKLFWSFAGVALLLALVGIYGVMSYTVSQRTREVGLRMALGARQGEVTAMVLRQGAWLVFLGLLVGLPLALGLGRVLSATLFEVRPFEPWTLAMMTAALVTVSLGAVLIPARRASRVDPVNSLRMD